MVTKDDLSKAFYCGHKLENAARKILKTAMFSDYMKSVTITQMDELLSLAIDASDHIKWMHKQLGDNLKDDNSLPIDSFYGQL